MIKYETTQLVEVDNLRLAIQIGPEAMGSRVSPIPVVSSVLVQPYVASAVLRSGSVPCFVDVSPKTMQMNASQVAEVAEELGETPILVLDDPLGLGFDPELLDLGFPTIGLYNVPIHEKVIKECPTDIAVFSLEEFMGRNALLYTPHEDLRDTLEHICRGELGYYSSFSDDERRRVEEYFSTMAELIPYNMSTIYYSYKKLLHDAGCSGNIINESEELSSDFYIRVRDAKKVVAHLHSYQNPGELVKPLYKYEEMASRWALTPTYPIAESIYKHVVKLPLHTYYDEQQQVIANILEIEDGKKEKEVRSQSTPTEDGSCD